MYYKNNRHKKTTKNINQETFQQNGISFVLNENNKTCAIKKNIYSSNNIFIPKSIYYKSNEYIITSINEHSFNNSKNIKSITFSNDSAIQLIGNFSFAYSSIENITIPSKVVKICKKAMYNCKSLTSIQLNDDSQLRSIDEYAFSGSSLNSISIPSHVKIIRQYSFYLCNFLNDI